MLSTLALLLLAGNPQEQTTLPRHPDPTTAPARERAGGPPTDPYFDRNITATDDSAFILTAIESGRQGAVDARNAGQALSSDALRTAADQIGKQNEAATRKLEALAKRKGWRLPEDNPGRAPSVTLGEGSRANASFIVNQISYHQNTLAQYRAQIAGKGDADLKRALREVVPGYEKNLQLLLQAKP